MENSLSVIKMLTVCIKTSSPYVYPLLGHQHLQEHQHRIINSLLQDENKVAGRAAGPSSVAPV